MAVNKVEVGGEVKLDLTEDTVTPETLLSGATAHNAAGDKIAGAVDLSSKQDKITVEGILKGSGDGKVEAAETAQASTAGTEAWTFTLEDGSTVSKVIPVLGASV